MTDADQLFAVAKDESGPEKEDWAIKGAPDVRSMIEAGRVQLLIAQRNEERDRNELLDAGYVQE